MTTSATATTPSTSLSSALRGFSLTYVVTDLRRVLRNRRALIFTLIMPSLMYVAFGAAQSYGNDTIGSANTKAYIMILMAVYGSCLATASNAASVALEQQAGWTRTLRLTPLTPLAYLAQKVAVAMAMAAIPMALLSAIGYVTGARADVVDWVGCLLLGWVGSAVFAAFGLVVGSLLKSEAAMQVLGMVMTLLAFAGSVFIPMKGQALTFASFTPMYGVATVAHYPITGGSTVYGEHISLIGALANIVVWAVIFSALATWAYKRGTARQ